MKTIEIPNTTNYIYVVQYHRTDDNGEDFDAWVASGGTITVAGDDPVEVAAFAMKHQWYPFSVDRVLQLAPEDRRPVTVVGVPGQMELSVGSVEEP